MKATWRWFLIAAAAAIAVVDALPNGTARTTLGIMIGLASLVMMMLGLLRQPETYRLGWAILTVAAALMLAGDGLSAITPQRLSNGLHTVSASSLLILAGMALILLGVWTGARTRGLAVSNERHADAAIVCLGVFALTWHPHIRQYIDYAGTAIGARIASALGVFLAFGMLFVVVCTLLAGVLRRSAELLLTVALASVVVAAAVDTRHITSTFWSQSAPGEARLLLYALLAAAILHPSSREPLPEIPDVQLRVGTWIPLVGVAGVLPSVTLLSLASRSSVADLVVIALVTLMIFALGALRMCWLFQRIRSQNRLLQARTESLEVALEIQRALRTDLHHRSLHDPLTGLPNRALLRERIDQALARHDEGQAHVVLLVCDMDRFQSVNDSRGHVIGDEILTSTGQRLCALSQGDEVVARLEGDEFALLLPALPERAFALTRAEAVVAALREPIQISGESLELSVSVGVAVAGPQTTSEQLLQDADTAMFEAKNAGRDRWALFEDDMRTRLINQLAITNSFAGSVQRNEFFLEFEPQSRTNDLALKGFEALVRWNHPTLGRIAPARFITHAEESGFIQRLGAWVLTTACLEAARWEHDLDRGVHISVNVSAHQVQTRTLADEVAAALSASRLKPSLLTLELTESALMLDPANATAILREVKELGVKIAIDDFGTGYSSLSYLRKFPVDFVKIDRSFIESLCAPPDESAMFVATIIRLAHELNLITVAEGVEEETQLQVLRELGCDEVQGYYVSRPMPRDVTARYVTTRAAAEKASGPGSLREPQELAVRSSSPDHSYGPAC